jgi:hypothetical protein
MTNAYKIILFLGVLALGLTGCRKENNTDNSAGAEDHSNIMLAADATIADATSAAGQVSGMAGKTEGGIELICGASSIDTGSGHKVIITYDNVTPCRGMIRGGSIAVSIISGPYWREAYAQLQIDLNNLSITNAVTGATYKINGSYTITNETGGLAWRILAGLNQNTSVQHRLQSSGLAISFPNGSQGTWNIDRTVNYSSTVSGSNNIVTIAVSCENTGQKESWGTNRNGDSFISNLINPLLSNNNLNCPYKPYQGEYAQIVGGKSVDMLYGVDNNGDPLNNASSCAYGYKITYTRGQKVLTKIVPYSF